MEREFDEQGLYWVQLGADLEPEVALYDHGVGRVLGAEGPVETAEIERIGRKVDRPAWAFDLRDQIG